MISTSPFTDAFLEKAERVFLNPAPLYPYSAIISGVDVNSQHGSVRRMWAVAQNTFRGFHRVNKSCPGAKEAFITYFLENAESLVASLARVTTSAELNSLADTTRTQLLPQLSNCKPQQLASYNKLRKPIDLYFQHLICMSKELATTRKTLVPFLNLPLDSQVFAHPHIFTNQDLETHQLSRNSTYQDVKSAVTYNDLQATLATTAEQLSDSLGRPFYPIFFDLLWNDRYRSWGGNLFETSP